MYLIDTPDIPLPYNDEFEFDDNQKFWVVTRGTKVGIFMSWYVLLRPSEEHKLTWCREEAGPHVLGVSNSVHRAYKGWKEACAAYKNAWDGNLVKVVRVS